MVNLALSVTPGKQPFVIVSNDDIARSVDELALLDHGVKIVASSSGASHGWLEFERLMPPSPLEIREESESLADKVVDNLIIFTSGTTSLPKGCKKEYPMMSAVTEGTMAFPGEDKVGPGSKFACVLPNNHSMAAYFLMEAHMLAAAVVFPSPGFQVSTQFFVAIFTCLRLPRIQV